MGNNVYANLVYGFPVLDADGEEYNSQECEPPAWLRDPDDEDGLLSMEDILTRLEGLEEPTEEFDKENPEILEKYRAYWAAQRKAEEECPVTLVEHCRSEHVMLILGIKESHHNPWRGDAARLGQRIEAKPEWREMLLTFCERVGIPFAEPEWLLAPFSE